MLQLDLQHALVWHVIDPCRCGKCVCPEHQLSRGMLISRLQAPKDACLFAVSDLLTVASPSVISRNELLTSDSARSVCDIANKKRVSFAGPK